MPILIDSSVVFAYAFVKDVRHEQAKAFLGDYTRQPRLVPAPVLSEIFYLTAVRVNYRRAVDLFTMVQSAFQLENLTETDMRRMQQIMRQYRDAEFDYTDTALMALAERLNITQIATFDRRDFSIFRPTHCEYLELLP